MKTQKQLTEVELELMNILWEKGEGTVHDVLEALPKNRPLAYTSVSTILRILEQKKVLKSRKVGRGHIYVPAIPKSEYEATSVKNLVEKVFGGEPVAVVRQLVNTQNLSSADLAEIRDLLSKISPGGDL